MSDAAPAAPPPPDFVIVGAAKCGTTSVHEYLAEHPSVFMTTPKETDFFYRVANGGRQRTTWGSNQRNPAMVITTPAAYRALFAAAAPGQRRGESSPSYLLDARVPRLLHDWNPDARIILVLRDPAERAWSDFLHNRLYGTEPLPVERFLEAFRDGGRRLADGWSLNSNYEIKGRYGTQLAQWLDVFPRAQVGVFLYDDLQQDAVAFMQSVFTFIGVDASFVPGVAQRYNVGGIPHRGWLHRLAYRPHLLKRVLRRLLPAALRRRLRARLQSRVLAQAPPLPAPVRDELARYYLPEIERLESLCGRDLSAWKPRRAT